jgi:hypothetical protein
MVSRRILRLPSNGVAWARRTYARQLLRRPEDSAGEHGDEKFDVGAEGEGCEVQWSSSELKMSEAQPRVCTRGALAAHDVAIGSTNLNNPPRHLHRFRKRSPGSLDGITAILDIATTPLEFWSTFRSWGLRSNGRELRHHATMTRTGTSTKDPARNRCARSQSPGVQHRAPKPHC